jgi:hypothetical protein
MQKKIQLPKEQVSGTDDTTFIDEGDVEGHRMHGAKPAPAPFMPHLPSTGGDAVPTDDEDLADHIKHM